MTPDPSFVYVTYINAPPERVWKALLEPEFTRLYWQHENVSDWEEGSRWEHRQAADPEKVDVVGTVVESDRPRRLVLTWVAPEHEGEADRTSRVAFDVEELDWPGGPWVRLTVTHTDLDEETHQGVSFGWPMVLSVMKTLVEQRD